MFVYIPSGMCPHYNHSLECECTHYLYSLMHTQITACDSVNGYSQLQLGKGWSTICCVIFQNQKVFNLNQVIIIFV